MKLVYYTKKLSYFYQCWRLFIIILNVFFAPIKGRYECYASLHCEEDGHIKTWYNTGKMLYGDQSCIVDLYAISKTNNKSCQIMWRINTSTYLLHTCMGCLCNITFPTACFTCIVTSQVFLKFWMQWSIALSSALYR